MQTGYGQVNKQKRAYLKRFQPVKGNRKAQHLLERFCSQVEGVLQSGIRLLLLGFRASYPEGRRDTSACSKMDFTTHPQTGLLLTYKNKKVIMWAFILNALTAFSSGHKTGHTTGSEGPY